METTDDRAAPPPRRLGRALPFVLVSLLAACAPGAQLDASSSPTRPAALLQATPNPTPTVGPPHASPPRPTPTPAAPMASPRVLPTGVVAEIPLDPGVAPFGVISDGHALWITAHRGTTVYKIDPTSNQVIARIDIGQEACGMPAIAFGRLWMEPCDDGVKVVAIDVATNAVVGSIPTPLQLGAYPGSSAIWATGQAGSGKDVQRIDPVTLKVTRTSPASRPYDDYVEADGTLWALDDTVSQIDQLDPATGKLLGSVVLPLPPDDSLYLMETGGGLWLEGYQTGDIVRVDAATHKVTSYTVPGYSHPTGYYDTPLAAALGSLWMRTSDRAVARLDPKTGSELATYPADTGGGAVAVAFGSLWVANFDHDTVWRERLTP